jgi:hypothetical protein
MIYNGHDTHASCMHTRGLVHQSSQTMAYAQCMSLIITARGEEGGAPSAAAHASNEVNDVDHGGYNSISYQRRESRGPRFNSSLVRTLAQCAAVVLVDYSMHIHGTHLLQQQGQDRRQPHEQSKARLPS